jgi:hypothetical protein
MWGNVLHTLTQHKQIGPTPWTWRKTVWVVPLCDERREFDSALSTSTYYSAAALLAGEVDTARAASCFRTVLQLQHAHMQLALQRVLHLQCLKPPSMQQLLSGSFAAGQQGLALVLGLPDPDHNLPAVTPLGTPVATTSSTSSTPAASSTKAGTSSSGCGGVSAWSLTVARAAAALEGGPVQWVKFVLSMQQELLAAIEALSKAAVAAAPGGSGLAGTPAAAAVLKLLQKLPEVWESVQKEEAAAAEMAGVLQALFKAEFSRGYGDVTNFMRGHLHTCPNGHFFVIGECGGAMQQSSCVECGAVVGGAHHALAEGNRRADDAVLQELQQQWSGRN